jgi:hypothetical protein
MDVNNEVNIGRKIREDALTAVSAVVGEYDLVIEDSKGYERCSGANG